MDRTSVVLFVLVLGTLMAAIDTTIVVLALPTIAEELHSALITVIWTILIYLFVVAVLTTQLGRIGDHVGRGRVFNTGFLVFTLGSALCGASPSAEALVAFRGIQAFGASMMQANSGAIIADIFPRNRRGMAYGFTALGWNVGALLGIVLGGVIITFLGWRYIFYINVPIGMFALLFGLKYIKTEPHTGRLTFDRSGFLIFFMSLLLLVYSATDVASAGPDFFNATLTLAGALLLVYFFIHERSANVPLIDVKAFRNRVLTFSLLATLFQSAGYLSVAFVLIMYLQGIRGLSPLSSSLVLAPGYVLSSLLGPYMGRLSDRRGAREIATVGLILMIAAVALYMMLSQNTPYDEIVAATLVGGVGSAMFFPANNSAVMANAQAGFYGGASGLQRTLANLGTLASYTLAITVSSISVSRQVAFEVFVGTTRLIGGVEQKFIGGIHSALAVAIVLLAAATFMSFIRGKESREVSAPAAEPVSRKSGFASRRPPLTGRGVKGAKVPFRSVREGMDSPLIEVFL